MRYIAGSTKSSIIVRPQLDGFVAEEKYILMTLDVVEISLKIKVAPKDPFWLSLLAADARHMEGFRSIHMSPLFSLSSGDAILNTSNGWLSVYFLLQDLILDFWDTTRPSPHTLGSFYR